MEIEFLRHECGDSAVYSFMVEKGWNDFSNWLLVNFSIRNIAQLLIVFCFQKKLQSKGAVMP